MNWPEDRWLSESFAEYSAMGYHRIRYEKRPLSLKGAAGRLQLVLPEPPASVTLHDTWEALVRLDRQAADASSRQDARGGQALEVRRPFDVFPWHGGCCRCVWPGTGVKPENGLRGGPS